jgi:metal-dependent amidase/aminoacylase/carboxypeptidase family protein
VSPHDRAGAEVDRLADVLIEVSHSIWDHPELCFEEHHAHDLLCDVLEAQGLTPTRHAYGLDTAFVAEAGTTGPVIAICCEYDALPDIGHACGHNVIAAAGLGAGLAARCS